MVNFEEHKEKLKEKEVKKRLSILAELHNINTEFLEVKIPEKRENINYSFLVDKKNTELEKLIKISNKLKEEAREARAKLIKNGIL